MPAEGKNVIRLGPIRLDIEERRVPCLASQVSLTPLLVKLLKVLMEHHGEVTERRELFRQVWDTEYTADTRALDVHISWLRQAIEIDPCEPKFLKTVRGQDIGWTFRKYKKQSVLDRNPFIEDWESVYLKEQLALRPEGKLLVII